MAVFKSSNVGTYFRYDRGRDSLAYTRDGLQAKIQVPKGLSTDDVFYYVYGLLNSPAYQEKYQNDLRKDLARIPLVAHKEQYVTIGKRLMDLHIHYEDVPAYPGVKVMKQTSTPSYRVEDKMKYVGKGKDAIRFNDDIVVENIPAKAQEYVVNGRPAIDWIIDQYHVSTDKASGIVDDPNKFSDDPKYILNLLLSVINVSVQTVDLVNQLPKLEIIDK